MPRKTVNAFSGRRSIDTLGEKVCSLYQNRDGFRVPGAGCRVRFGAPGSVGGSRFGSGFQVPGARDNRPGEPSNHPNPEPNPEPNREPGTRHPEPTLVGVIYVDNGSSRL